MQPSVEQLLIVPISQQRETLSRFQSWAEYAVNSATHSSIKQTWHPHRRLPETTEGQVGKQTKHKDAENGNTEKDTINGCHVSTSRVRRRRQKKTWTNKTHQRSKIPDVSLGIGRQTEGNLKAGTRNNGTQSGQRQNKISGQRQTGKAVCFLQCF